VQRGDIITVVAPGDFGKPRPAVVIQGDVLNQAQPRSVVVALITSTLVDAPLLRLTIKPAASNGLKKPSQVQANKILTLRIKRIGQTIGRLSEKQMLELNRLLAMIIGLA
jgi:mRNA interferase MazF